VELTCTPSPARVETHRIEGLLLIGGWAAYESAYKLFTERDAFPAFNIPTICLPATIDNNLPGSELSVGADTALKQHRPRWSTRSSNARLPLVAASSWK